jgi:hypothetical protein
MFARDRGDLLAKRFGKSFEIIFEFLVSCSGNTAMGNHISCSVHNAILGVGPPDIDADG